MAVIHVAEDIAKLVQEQKSTTAAFLLNYHVVFRTKRNRRFLEGEVGQEGLTLILDVAEKRGYKILAAALMPDHVHLVVALTPSDRVSDAVRYFKGTTARLLREKFPRLRDATSSLWSEGYYVESVGLKNVKQVLSYVSRQEEHHRDD
ncbi:MAG: IS200/IS605 family transposase [candidate division Zixibacteria bacterium]|nr:IS200/IS605 family transposase [candidate division Zixibacteria bacterium]